jgi:two-component system, NtrC family, response regulator HydG
MKGLLSYVEIMSRSGTPILITGESGTGKELIAKGIHQSGPQPGTPFIAVNVASVPETLFESQFFGHARGAFTGAEKDMPGYFEQANGGTLFLDEIGELPIHLQAKLLRVLEDKTVVRIGDSRGISIVTRIVSATNQNLDKACQEGRFRLDLLYRLKSAHIHLPPLRERGKDVLLLASHFLKKACIRHNKQISGFSPEALSLLSQETFPGNIRELIQWVEKAVLLSNSDLIQPQDLNQKPGDSAVSFTRALCSLKENDDIHTAYVLTQTRGNRSQAAQILGVSVRQIQRKLNQIKENPRLKPLVTDFL